MEIFGNTFEGNGTAVTHAGVVLVGHEVWLVGGRIGAHPGAVSDKVWIYNLNSKSWRKGPRLPKRMAGGGAALVNNKIYTFGGMDAQAKCDVNFHYVYDLGNPSIGWQNKTGSAGMPSPRNHFSTVVVNNIIYAIGGQHGHDGCPGKAGGNVKLVHSYNPQSNQWKRLADLPAIESHNEPSTFVHHGFIYTVGGATAGNKVLRFDPALNTWEHIVNLPEPLLAPVARIYAGKLVVGGGGAPITAKSNNLVRSIKLAQFNDKATNYSAPSANSSTATNTATTTGTASITDDGLVISVEAESFHSKTGTATHQWVNASLSGASAGASMIATPDAGAITNNANGSPKLSYNIQFAQAGQYHLWVRGWGDENTKGQGTNDSLHAGLNEAVANTADKIDGFPNGWHWSKRTRDGAPATLNIPSAGTHTVNLWMREDGLAVDKFLLVKNSNYVPSSTGPDASQAANNNTAGTNTNNPIVEPTVSVGAGGNTDTNTVTNTNSGGTNALIVIEAENYRSKTGAGSHHWVNASYPNASGATSMISSPNSGTLKQGAAGSPMMSYNASFPQSGLYRVWIRGWGDEQSNGRGGNDSVHAGLNNVIAPTADNIDGFPVGWNWSNRTRDGSPATISVPSAGNHTFNLWMREDGFAVDKIILTKDATYVPSGVGSADTQANNTSTTPVNVAPTVNAGSDASVMVNVSVNLVGSAVDDKTAVSALRFAWTKVSGPGSVVLRSASSASTSVSFTKAGTYVLKLTVNDGALSGSDQITVSVNASNPTANTNVANGTATRISIEAEDYFTRTGTPSHQWVNANLPGASANASMITTPNAAALKAGAQGSPMLGYLVNFSEAGDYYLWVRGWGDERSNGAGTNDSLHAGLNGRIANSADKIDGFPAGWHWSRRTRDGAPAKLVVPNAGTHSVNLWMREDGLAVDKFLLSKDASFVPTGIGALSSTTNSASNSGTGNTQSQSNGTTNTGTNADIVANANRAWEMVQTMNGGSVVARHEAGAVTSNNKLYMMGGRGNRPVQSYSESDNKWTSHGAAPVLMHHFQPVAIGNKVYAIGAMKDDNFPTEKPLEHVYVFNTSNHTWSKGAAIPVNRRRGSVGAAVHNGKIYLVGGNTNGHSGPAVNWFDEFDPATNQWRVMPNAPNARDHATVAVAGGKLVVAAGRRSQHPNVLGATEGKTDMFNFVTGRWETSADNIPTQRAGTMTVAVGNEIVVIGGESLAHVSAHNEVEALNVATGKWRKLQPLLLGRHSGGATLLGGKIHVVSGNSTRGGGNESVSHETLSVD